MNPARLAFASALALLLAPAAAALPLPPTTHCQFTVIGTTQVAVCFDAVGDLSTLAPGLGPNACASSTPIPTGTYATFAVTCCFSTAGGTLLCFRGVGVAVA